MNRPTLQRKTMRKPFNKLPAFVFPLIGLVFLILSPILMTVEAWLNYVNDGRMKDYTESIKLMLFGRIEE